MLDLNHPETPLIFAIAREDDAILSIAKRMTLVDTAQKQLLLEQSKSHFATMRTILARGWGKSAVKSAAIELLEQQLTFLASLPSTNEFVKDWRGKLCTVCGSEITNLEKYQDMLYCPSCLNKLSEGREAVDQAFGLMWI